jgi:hypothetical protein
MSGKRGHRRPTGTCDCCGREGVTYGTCRYCGFNNSRERGKHSHRYAAYLPTSDEQPGDDTPAVLLGSHIQRGKGPKRAIKG